MFAVLRCTGEEKKGLEITNGGRICKWSCLQSRSNLYYVKVIEGGEEVLAIKILFLEGSIYKVDPA